MSARPPRLMERLLRLLLPRGIVREDVVGSLGEELAQRLARDGRRRARWWYRRHAAGVALWAARKRLAGRHGPTRGIDMSTFGMDLGFAWRSMRRAPASHLVALLTVALGVGVNTAMFSVVNGVLLAPMPYPEPDRIVELWFEKRWSVQMYQNVRDATQSFEVSAGGMRGSLTLLGDGEPEVVGVMSVTAEWLDVLGVHPALGRGLVAEDEIAADGHVALLSHGLWTRRFGADPEIVGRTIELSGYGVERRTVVGVLPAKAAPLFGAPEVWIPWIADADIPGSRSAYGGSAIARLRSGVSQEQSIAEMRGLIPHLSDAHSSQFRDVRFSPVDVVPLKEAFVRGVRSQLLVLLGAVGFVLLIACSNVANLLLARTSTRRREIGLRLAMGADRGRVLRQMLTESALLGLVGGAAGLATALLAMPLLRAELGQHLPRTSVVGVDVTVALYAAAVSLGAGLVIGVVPALRAAREDPAAVLNDQGRGSSMGRRGARASHLLVTAEIALSLVLVVGAGLMLKSLQRLSGVDLGFDREGVLHLNVVVPSGRYDEADARRALFQELLDRVHAVAGVQGAAFVNEPPLGGGWGAVPYAVEGQELPAGQSIVAGWRLVSPEYFDLLGIGLVEGRLLDATDTSEGEGVAVVNRAFVQRHWPGGSALDQTILSARTGEPFARIVGVVEDTRFAQLSEAPIPAMYRPADQTGWNVWSLLVRVSSGHPLDLASPVTAAIHLADPALPVRNPRSLDDIVADAAGSARFYTRLLAAFAGLALALAVVGVYGVMSYAVSRRTREIGIRVALGARGQSVLRETLRRGASPVLAGIALGLGGAWIVSRSLAGLLYEVTPTDPWVYAAVACLLALAGVAAMLVPARRAVRVDPMTALRSE